MPTADTASFTNIKEVIHSYLNVDAQVAYGQFDTTLKAYHPELIKEEIRLQDLEVQKSIIATIGHPHRVLYKTENIITLQHQTIVDSGGEFDTPLIEISSGVYREGIKLSAMWVEEFNSTSDGFYGDVLTVNGYYDVISGNRLIFTGLSAKVNTYSPTKSITDAIYSPVEYQPTILNLALGRLYNKQSDQAGAAAFYIQQGFAGLQEIRERKLIVPSFVVYQQQES